MKVQRIAQAGTCIAELGFDNGLQASWPIHMQGPLPPLKALGCDVAYQTSEVIRVQMANEDYSYLMLVNAIPQHLELSAFATVQQVVLTVVSENLGRLMTVKGRRSGTTAKDCKLHILPALVDKDSPIRPH